MSADPTPPPPTVTIYSTAPDPSGTPAHHTVTIAADQLQGAAEKLREVLSRQGPHAAARALHEATNATASFGSIPNADHVQNEVRDFIANHMAAMQSMGDLVEDFVARVAAAASIGRDGNADTQHIVNNVLG